MWRRTAAPTPRAPRRAKARRRLSKISIVAISEFLTLVRTKAFLIGVFLMPVFMGSAIVLQRMTMDRVDTAERSFAVLDHAGGMYEPLARAAEAWNRAAAPGGRPRAPTFRPARVDVSRRPLDEVRLELSERIRREELFAFVEIPAKILDAGSGDEIKYYSNHPAHTTLPQWLETTIGREVLNRRFEAASVDRALIDRLTRAPDLESLGLLERDQAGGIKAAAGVDRMRTFAIPAAFMFIMFLVVMTSSPQLLNSVIEEKMSRISEVLVASVTPFQLMMGKLTGSVGVSLLLAVIYLTGGYALAYRWDYADVLTPDLIAWFFLYLVIAVFLFGSLFIAIGAACTDLKDAQTMMTPAMLLVMIPALTWSVVIRAPESAFSVGVSLFPPSTPFIMLLRIALRPAPPLWQVVLSLLLVAATVVAAVWAAGRIFRAGLLMHGKAATPREMLRWIVAG
jgi:ABC-type Na+ efflux pump permease subunit